MNYCESYLRTNVDMYLVKHNREVFGNFIGNTIRFVR